jgi:predicted lactoylglutathione lyase
MVFSDTIHVMLLTHDKYRQFTTKPIADTQKTSAAMFAITKDQRDSVDAVLGAALKGGATEPRDKMDFGWMYNRAFDDLDGHTWEVVWMDMAGFDKATGQAA